MFYYQIVQRLHNPLMHVILHLSHTISRAWSIIVSIQSFNIILAVNLVIVDGVIISWLQFHHANATLEAINVVALDGEGIKWSNALWHLSRVSYPITSFHDPISYHLSTFVAMDTKKPVEIMYSHQRTILPTHRTINNCTLLAIKLLTRYENTLAYINTMAWCSNNNSLEVIWLAIWNAIADKTSGSLVQRCMARSAAQARWMKLVIRMYSHNKSVHDWLLASMANLRW